MSKTFGIENEVHVLVCNYTDSFKVFFLSVLVIIIPVQIIKIPALVSVQCQMQNWTMSAHSIIYLHTKGQNFIYLVLL